MRQDILHINCSNECLELCLLTPQLQFIQRQLLKLCIRPSILILENLNNTDSLEALNLEFLLIEYQKNGQNSIRVVLVGSFTLSLFSDLFLPIYIVLKPKLNILDNSDNNGSISYINTGTCMCCIHSNLHFSFILDLSFSLRYLIRNRRREYTKLDLVILYFSKILKELFEAISALNRCIYKDSKSTSNINIRISILIFGINTNDSSYQLILHDTCISDCEVTSIFLDLIILNIQEEIGRLLYQSLEFYNSSYLTNNWWNFELKLYLDSLPSEFDKSVIIITDGIISKNLKAATEVYKDDQILCLNNDIIRTCISNDIQVHIVLVKDSEPEYKTSYGMVPSIETLEYLTRCCCNGSMTIVDEEIVDNLKLKQIVKNLLFRNTEVSIVDTLSIEELYLNCFLYKSYLLDKRISLLDIFASKMMIGYNLLFKDQLISVPVILVAQFHSFVNIYYTVDDYDYNRWSVKIYIQDINGIFKFNTLYNSEYELGTGYKQSEIANFELNSSTYNMDEQTCDIECLIDDNKSKIIFGKKLFSSGRSLYSKKDILFQNINLYINMMVNIDYLLNDISKVLSGQHLNLQSQKLIDSNLLPHTFKIKNTIFLNILDYTLKINRDSNSFDQTWKIIQEMILSLEYKLYGTYKSSEVNNCEVWIYYFLGKGNENMYFSNINEKICFEDQTIWNIMRSWCSDICTRNINLELYEQIQNIKKDNRYYIQWLKLYRYLSKDEKKNSELSSLVTIYSLYHGLSQQICEENSKKLLDNIYIKIMNFGDNYLVSGYNSVSAKFSYIENLKIGPEHLGVLSPVKSIEYILFSIVNTQNCFVNQLQMKRSWKYMLWNTSSNIFDRKKQIFNKECLSMFLSHRIISTLGKARYHEDWILLYVKEISTNIRVVWIKFVIGKNQGNMNQKEIKDEIVILVYEISIIFDRNSSGSPIVCTLYMIKQNNIINSLEPNYCDLFTYFLDYIQNQDNNIIKAISLINYLSNFNNIKNKVQFRRNSTGIFKSRSTINRRVNLNLEEMSILFLALSKRSSEEIEHFNNDTGKFTKSLDHINCIDQFSKCLIGSDNEYSVFENKKTQHTIKEFESYCSIEINPFKQDYSFEYFNTDNHEKRVIEKSKYLFWKSKMKEIACDLLDKFINKINRRAEYSLRIEKYEWYLFNFLNSAKISCNLRCNQTLNYTESEHIFNEHFLIIHIYPEKWSEEQFKKEKYIETTINDTNNYIELNILKLDFYIGNCNALCCGVTSNLNKIFFDNFDFSLYCKYSDNKCEGILNESIIEDSVNLYIQDVLYIWNTLRFKAICDYCTHNIPVHYRDIDILLDDRQSKIFFKNYIANMVYTSRDILNIDETISKMKHKPIKFSVPISIFQKVLYSAFKKLRPSSNILHYVSNNQDILKMIKCMESELIARIGTQTFGFQIVKTVSSSDHCDFITLFSQYSNYHKFGEIEITDNSFINEKDNLINCVNSTEFRKEANNKLKRPLYLYNLKKYGYRPSLLVMKVSSSSIELLDKQKSLIYSFIKLKGEKMMTSLNPNALTYWLFLITCLCILESSNLNIDIFIYEYNKCTKLKEYCTSKYFDIYEHFVEKLRCTIYHWIIDTAMELSFTHNSDNCLLEKIIGINGHRHSIDNLSLFGRDLFLECIQITQKVVWNQNNPDLNILQKLEHLHGSSIMYTSSIYIPLLPFFLKKNKDDYASFFNSFSSKVDLVPIQRDPLILLWTRNKKKILLNEDEKINLQKDEYEYLDLNSIQNHFRIFISMQFDVDEIENLPNSEIKSKLNYLNNGSFTCVSSMNNQLLNLDDNNLYLKVSFFLYSPSSIELVKLQENNSSKIWCKFCNCKFLGQSLNEIISFCFSSIQERFIKMWKEFSIDFLLKNTINTKTASPYIIPIISEEPFASINDYCSPIEFLETAKSVHNNYEANLYMRIFGNPNTTSLYNIPFGMTPSYYLQTQNSLYHKSSKIEDTSNFGKITLWDGKQVQIPHYTFWLNPQDEISLEIPYNLFNIPLLDGFLTTNFTDNKIYNSSISCLAFQFASFTINSPKGWLCCSDDIILTSPLTSGTGSVFLIKPGYLLMNKSKDGKQSSSTVGLSLTFFGVRKPSKGTKGHFMKYLKIALQNFGKKTNNLDYSKNEFNEVLQLSSLKIGNDEKQIDDSTLIRRNSWSKSDLTGASNIVINTSPIYFNDSNTSLKFNSNNITDKNHSPKLLLQEIPLPEASAIWRMSSAFHNYIAISLWNIAKKTEVKLYIKDILLRFVKRLNIMGFNDIINEDLENNRSRVRFIIPKNVIMQFYNFKASPNTENLNSKQKILSEYCIDIAIFSGIDGMPLPMNGAWGGGVRLGEQINSSIILLSIYEDDIDKWQQLIWDINENLDLLDVTTNNRTIRANISNNTGSYSPWNILRNHEGHSIQVQPSLPVHIIPESFQDHSLNSTHSYKKANIWLMPCLYITTDIWNFSKLLDYESALYEDNFGESSKFHTELLELVKSLLNLTLLDLAFELRFMKQEATPTKEHSNKEPQLPTHDREKSEELRFGFVHEINNDSSLLNNGDILIPSLGSSIRHLFKYKEELQNILQNIRFHENLVHKFSSSIGEHDNQTNTLSHTKTSQIMHYSVPILSKFNLSSPNDFQTQQLYNPSWSIQSLLNNIYETVIRENFSKNKNFKAYLIGHSCFIHDLEQLDKFRNDGYPQYPNTKQSVEIRNDDFNVDDLLPDKAKEYLNINFSSFINEIQTIETRESGWHVSKYTSSLKCCEFMSKDIQIWIDSLYEKNYRNLKQNTSNDMDFNSTFCSLFKLCGGRIRPRITIILYSSDESGTCEIEDNSPSLNYANYNDISLRYYAFIDITPNGILLLSWYLPKSIESKLKNIFSDYIWNTTLYTLWLYQLIGWNNSIKDDYIPIIDLSPFAVSWDYISSSLLNTNYGVLCGLPIYIIYFIWSKYFNLHLYPLKSPEKLFSNVCVSLNIQIYNLKSCHNICSLMNGAIPIFLERFDFFLEKNHLTNEYVKYNQIESLYPSVLQELISQQANQFIKEWMTLYSKYRFWNYINLLLTSTLSNWNREVNLIKLKSDQVDFNFSHKLLNIYDIFEDKFYNTLEFLLEEMELIFSFFSKKKMSHLSVFPSKLLNYSNENNNVNIEKYSTHLNLLYTLSDFKSQLVEILEYITKPNLQHYHNWLLHPELEENFESDTHYNRVNIHNATLDNETTCYIPKDLGCLKCLEDFQTISISLIIAILLLDESPKTKIQRVNIKKGIQIQQAKTSYKYSDKQSYDISLVIYKQIFKDLPFCSSSQSYYLNVLNSLTEAIDRHMNMMNMIRIKHSFGQPLFNSSNIYIIIRILRTFSLIRSNYIFQDNLQHLSQNIFQEAPLIPLQISQELIYIGTLYNNDTGLKHIICLLFTVTPQNITVTVIGNNHVSLNLHLNIKLHLFSDDELETTDQSCPIKQFLIKLNLRKFFITHIMNQSHDCLKEVWNQYCNNSIVFHKLVNNQYKNINPTFYSPKQLVLMIKWFFNNDILNNKVEGNNLEKKSIWGNLNNTIVNKNNIVSSYYDFKKSSKFTTNDAVNLTSDNSPIVEDVVRNYYILNSFSMHNFDLNTIINDLLYNQEENSIISISFNGSDLLVLVKDISENDNIIISFLITSKSSFLNTFSTKSRLTNNYEYRKKKEQSHSILYFCLILNSLNGNPIHTTNNEIEDTYETNNIELIRSFTIFKITNILWHSQQRINSRNIWDKIIKFGLKINSGSINELLSNKFTTVANLINLLKRKLGLSTLQEITLLEVPYKLYSKLRFISIWEKLKIFFFPLKKFFEQNGALNVGYIHNYCGLLSRSKIKVQVFAIFKDSTFKFVLLKFTFIFELEKNLLKLKIEKLHCITTIEKRNFQNISTTEKYSCNSIHNKEQVNYTTMINRIISDIIIPTFHYIKSLSIEHL